MNGADKKVGRPRADIDKYFAKISEFLMLGYSLNRACLLGDVPYRTVKDYYDTDENFRNKCDRLMTDPNVKARLNWVRRIGRGDYVSSKDWLERREREDFSTRSEQVSDVTLHATEALLEKFKLKENGKVVDDATREADTT